VATQANSRLSVTDASVSFGGITALDGVSLEANTGEVLGVIGPNGAGKTTLFNLICGFVPADSGTIEWCGRPLLGTSPNRLASLGIARTLQGVGLFRELTVLENVMVGAERFRRVRLASALLGLPFSDRDERLLRERAMSALETVSCTDVASRIPGTLPYAVQKRVALARALASDPELLMLDEPAGGLDAGELEELAKVIDALRSRIAVMLVDHHMDLVTSVCDRLVVLDFGRVIASGVPSQVRQDPRVLDAYLGREAEAEPAAELATEPAATGGTDNALG
jgi:branched-chain amino acid transport system ATP-binding protein